MYIPKKFAETNIAVLHQFMNANNFAALVTHHEGELLASHIPFMVDATRGEYGVLVAHLARANPQWKHLTTGSEVMVLFQGAHAYISPSWYEEHPSVPTWNYTAVHAYGLPHLIEDETHIRAMLHDLVDYHEQSRTPAWELNAPDDYMDRQIKAIVAFEIPITRLEGKYKLSQNRSEADQQHVIDALGRSQHPLERQTAALMHDRKQHS